MIVYIRQNSTAEVRAHFTHYNLEKYEDSDEWNTFMWTEGNYACDCNRSIFWHVADGAGLNLERPCGDKAYTVTHVIMPGGERVEIDSE